MTNVSEEEFVRLYSLHNGNTREMAAAIGISQRSVQRRIKTLMESQDVIDAPVARQSTLTDADGNLVLQWNIRVRRHFHDQEMAAIAAMQKELAVLPPRALISGDFNENLANNYVLTDKHVGMVVQKTLYGEDWDLESSKYVVLNAFQHMIATSPKTDVAIITILGDWFHMDTLLPLTLTGGNVLLGTTSLSAMVDVGIFLMRKLIDMALMNHKKVIVVVCEGNHDLVGSLWLRKMMKHLYEANDRVEFVGDDDESPFYALQFGETFLGYHHGHIKSLRDEKELALLFAEQFPTEFGATKRRYIHTGHLHHLVKKEVAGFELIQHRTLASKDAHAIRGGYRAGRAAVATSYHKKFGEVSSATVTPEMLLPAA